jgi:molecular chaperone IbpA
MRTPAVSGASSYPCLLKEDMAMRTFDFSPFVRNAIGFEPLFDRLNKWPQDNNEGYPPYDIVRRSEDGFQINIALAKANLLTVVGKKEEKEEVEYLYRGISARAFERRFNLAEYIEVESAAFENGCCTSTSCGASRTR